MKTTFYALGILFFVLGSLAAVQYLAGPDAMRGVLWVLAALGAPVTFVAAALGWFVILIVDWQEQHRDPDWEKWWWYYAEIAGTLLVTWLFWACVGVLMEGVPSQ